MAENTAAVGHRRTASCCETLASIAASGSDTCMTLAPTGNAISVSKRSSPWPHDASIPCALEANGRRRPEDCRGAWGYLERLDQHRLYPPLEAMGVVAEAINTLLAADPQTSVREALGDLDEFREAVDCLEAYEQFRPDHFDRARDQYATPLPHVVCRRRTP